MADSTFFRHCRARRPDTVSRLQALPVEDQADEYMKAHLILADATKALAAAESGAAPAAAPASAAPSEPEPKAEAEPAGAAAEPAAAAAEAPAAASTGTWEEHKTEQGDSYCALPASLPR